MLEPSRAVGFAHVAIDGPAGSGKTTVARRLSEKLGLLYLDTGAMYRAVALLALRGGVPIDDEAAVLRLARAHPIDVQLDRSSPLGFRILADHAELGPELYGNLVSTVVSVVAAYPSIRELMVERQRAIAGSGPVVMAGRDIGTVVLPEAPVKIYLDATLERRVERRQAELAAHGVPIDREELRAQMRERDRLDRERPVAPLRPAPGARIIDSSDLSVEEVVAAIAATAAGSASAP